MKRIISLLSIVLMVMFANVALGQVPSANPVVSQEDAIKIKNQLAELSKAMGNPAPVSSVPPASTTNTESAKSMATVADKALDMVGGAVATLSSSLSKIAPQVWRIMIRQQYAKAVEGIATPTLLFLFTLVFMVIMRKMWKPELSEAIKENVPKISRTGLDQEDVTIWKYVFRSVLPSIFLIIIVIIFCCSIGDSVKLLINPEYYAVKDILLMITNPGQPPQ